MTSHSSPPVCSALLGKRTSEVAAAKARALPPQKKAKLQVKGKKETTTASEGMTLRAVESGGMVVCVVYSGNTISSPD